LNLAYRTSGSARWGTTSQIFEVRTNLRDRNLSDGPSPLSIYRTVEKEKEMRGNGSSHSSIQAVKNLLCPRFPACRPSGHQIFSSERPVTFLKSRVLRVTSALPVNRAVAAITLSGTLSRCSLRMKEASRAICEPTGITETVVRTSSMRVCS
jgi:hypothetical protein